MQQHRTPSHLQQRKNGAYFRQTRNSLKHEEIDTVRPGQNVEPFLVPILQASLPHRLAVPPAVLRSVCKSGPVASDARRDERPPSPVPLIAGPPTLLRGLSCLRFCCRCRGRWGWRWRRTGFCYHLGGGGGRGRTPLILGPKSISCFDGQFHAEEKKFLRPLSAVPFPLP